MTIGPPPLLARHGTFTSLNLYFRDYFLSLGGYDPGLLVWGGENFELSFKV
mgnify:CR=1 FL=1